MNIRGYGRIIAASFCCLLSVCALSGKVVDQGNFETSLTDVRLNNGDYVKIYYGGSKRRIPLSDISTIVINSSVSITVEKELYFNADITLKDGTRLKSIGEEKTVKTEVFVCVHHELIGRHNRERYRAGFERIQRLVID